MTDSIFDQLPLIDEGGQPVLPSPKMKSKSKEGVQSWSHAYAGFSIEFAISAIKALNDKDNLMFFDPFSGSGTSAVAAFHQSVNLTAIDLDPFSALLTRAKVAKNYDKSKLFKYLSGSTRSIGNNFSVEAKNLFLDIDLKYANNVFKNIASELSSNTSELWDKFLNDPDGDYDTEVLALASMVIASRGCAKVARGSNPVWLRQLFDNEVHEHVPLRKLTKDFAQKMMVDLSLLKDGNNETTIKVLNSDFLDKNIQIGSIDRILTSPPYLNRLDYVVSHKPEIAILTGFIPLSIEGLREKMMGTTKMIERVEPKEEWGEECLLLIDKIRNHPSKASSTYYYKFFLQYFDCCMKMFSRFRDVCNDDALGALVVQDSFYKDVRVPLTAILSDMARNYGITTHKWRSEEVKGHIGSMNPAQKSYVPTKVLEETVLFLEF